MAVVYKHIRKDTNEIFYIGIGSKDVDDFISKRWNKGMLKNLKNALRNRS